MTPTYNEQTVNSLLKSFGSNQHTEQYIKHCQAQLSLKDALYVAAKSINAQGSKHSHQRRIPAETLDSFASNLARMEAQINRSQDFHTLWSIIKKVGEGIKGIGPLTVYDTALRISAFLGKKPDRVYLHCGALKGARKILGKVKGEYLNLSAFPSIFHNMEPADVEDFLCIYKDQLDQEIAPFATQPRDCGQQAKKRVAHC